jgi:hypothetical protein
VKKTQFKPNTTVAAIVEKKKLIEAIATTNLLAIWKTTKA